MASLGIHFALTLDQEKRLLAAVGDDEVMGVIGEIAGDADKTHRFCSERTWAALHRCLTDGSLAADAGNYPLSHAVLGGRRLYYGSDSIVSYVTADQVRDVSVALNPIGADWLRCRYLAVGPTDRDGGHDEADFARIRENFHGLKIFFAVAATEGRSVIFTVDRRSAARDPRRARG